MCPNASKTRRQTDTGCGNGNFESSKVDSGLRYRGLLYTYIIHKHFSSKTTHTNTYSAKESMPVYYVIGTNSLKTSEGSDKGLRTYVNHESTASAETKIPSGLSAVSANGTGPSWH